MSTPPMDYIDVRHASHLDLICAIDRLNDRLFSTNMRLSELEVRIDKLSEQILSLTPRKSEIKSVKIEENPLKFERKSLKNEMLRREAETQERYEKILQSKI